MDGGAYKEERNEVQVRRNKLCSWCTCTSLSVNVEWIWFCTDVGQVKEEVPMLLKQFPRQFQIFPRERLHHLRKATAASS